MVNIKSLLIPDLKEYFRGIGERDYRAYQVFSWLWNKGISDFDLMTDIKKTLRNRLKQEFYISRFRIASIQRSKDGSIKFLFIAEDGEYIESVYIPDGRRRTVCVSSQIGCALGCRFCRTGKDGFVRNLKFFEIAQQVLEISLHVKERITNVVFMGMGEPLLNIDEVLKSIEVMNHPSGMAIGKRHITISTAGVVPGIYELMTRNVRQVKLAVSLNSPFDDVRTYLMPINRRYPLEELMKAIRDFTEHTGKRVTVEYVLIEGVNDTRRDAEALIRLLRGIPLKINLIPYNPVEGVDFKPPSMEKVERFARYLYPHLPAVSIRRSRGRDIKGACGQLRAWRKG